MAVHQVEQILVAGLFHLLGNLVLHRGGGRVLAPGVAKDESVVERDGVAQSAGLLIVPLRLARESHNNIRRNRYAGTRRTDALGKFLEFFGRVAPTHDFQDAVGSALEREMNMLDEFGQAHKGFNQIIAVTNRVGGCEAHALDAIHRADGFQQLDKG